MRRWFVGLMWFGTLPIWGQASNWPERTAVQPDRQWERVRALVPGESIELRDRATGVHTECVLAYASYTALGCDTGGPYDPLRRVVYPKSAIGAVWVVRWVHGPSGKAMLIGASIGGVLGGILLGESSSKGATATGIGLGATLGLGLSNLGDPFHTRLSKRTHLMYRGPRP